MESPLSFNSTENFRKKLLVRNLQPYKVEGFYNYSEELPKKEIQIVDYSIIDSPALDIIQNLKEPELIGLNKYSQVGGFGNIVSINDNLGSLSNFGEYKVNLTVNSLLENYGQLQENLLRVLNKYNPENVTMGFGDSVTFNTSSLGSNQGEYDYFSSQPNITTEQSQILSYVANIYGPENLPNGFGSVVDININNQTQTNKGEYNYLTSPPERTTERSRIIAYVSNQYGPEDLPNGYGLQIVNANINQNNKTNEGEYDYFRSEPNKTTEQSQSHAYLKNKYTTGEGSYELLTIDDIAQETLNVPYASSESTFVFIPSEYDIVNLIQNNNPSGSDGNLSQDSILAQLGAKQLQKEFKARVAYELLQQTVGRSNLFTGEINPVTGQASIQQNNDPFDALGIITNNIPIIQKNYKITGGPTAVANALGFVAKLSGLYSPYSLIPGEYFDYPNRNFLSQVASNPIGAVAGLVGNLAQEITSLFLDSSSKQFLLYTSDATKGLLFDQLFYNNYRPDYRFAGLTPSNLLAPKGSFYVGKNKNYIRDLVSPKVDLPKGRYNKPQVGPVYSYGEVGKEYEGNKVSDFLFGLNSRSFFDSVDIQGGFTWISNRNYIEPGVFVGPSNKKNILAKFNTDSLFETSQFKPLFDKTKSTNLPFTDGSILDITQKLVDAGNRSTRKLEHVGNAINQVSKVFNDGYIELTKGSRVIRYVTPTAKKPNGEPAEVKGYEYCRLFTKDRPYYSFNELQKTDGNIRKSSYSILDNTYNLNIAPMRGEGSTNIKKNGKVKKYMFSLENLAWRSSNRKGYRVEDLPACEVGPNGGRIMWFPPYDLSFDETSTPSFTENQFLGRPESIWTYKNTKRSGTISWKILVDHPSIMNLLIDKELQNVKENSEVTKIVDSFMAGCLKYDIYDLLKKYREFTLSDIYEVVDTLGTVEQYENYLKELPTEKVEKVEEISKNADLSEEIQDEEELKEISLLFDQSIPNTSTGYNYNESDTYEVYYNQYKSQQSLYEGEGDIPNKIIKYNSRTGQGNNNFIDTLPNDTQSFSYAEYVDGRASSIGEVFNFFENEFDTFKNKFLPKVLGLLKQGKQVTFSVDAGANSAGNSSSNQSLSERRRKSVINFIENFQLESDKLKPFIENNKLIIKGSSVGDSAKQINELNYKDINCSKKFNVDNKYDGKFSVQAMVCRRVKISGLDIKNTENEGNNTNESNVLESQPSQPNSAEENNTETNTPQYENQQSVVTTEIKDKTNKIRDGLTKRLLRKLLTECNYFDMVREQQPMIYDGIKSKIKNFQPAFHSITPEGLNSRLTFLQQCVRPGDTIPTAVDDGQGGTILQYNDAFNSAFGTPPVLVLRIGDFFHTKIIPGALTIKYQDLKFDINPEGIGVQPMIAEISLSIQAFIGGQGIKEPISKLQNALSFNYYANTELYDERAEETESFTSELDAEILKDIQDEIGLIDPNKERANDGGDTIGTIESSFADPNSGLISGRINYKDKMNELIDKTLIMVNSFNQNILNIIETLSWGGLIILTKDRKYTQGLFDYLSGDTSNVGNILGKPINYQSKIDELFNKAKEDVDNDLSPVLGGLQLKQEFKPDEIRKVKRKLKELIDREKSSYVSILDGFTNDVVKNELDFIKLLDQINFVANALDGRINKKGGVNIYQISGTTPVEISSVGANTTLEELKQDLLSIKTDLNNYDSIIKTNQLIPNGDKNVYNSNFTFNLYLTTNKNNNTDDGDVSAADRRFAMIFISSIRGGYAQFVDEIVSTITSSSNLTSWKDFIYQNLGFKVVFQPTGNLYLPRLQNDSGNKYYLKVLNSGDKLYESIYRDIYKKSEIWKKFFESTYKPYNRDKLRKFTYSTQIPIVSPNDINLKEIYATVDNTWDYYNGKRKMI